MMNFSKYDEFINESLKVFKENALFIEEENLELYINVTLGISIAQEEPIKTATIALIEQKNLVKDFLYITQKLIQKSQLKILFIIGERK